MMPIYNDAHDIGKIEDEKLIGVMLDSKFEFEKHMKKNKKQSKQ